MADIKKISVAGTEYDLKDSGARQSLIELDTQVKSTKQSTSIQKHTKQVTGYSNVATPNNAIGGVDLAIKGRSLYNEINYNPVTWEGWQNNTGTKDSSGITIPALNGSYPLIVSPIFKFKPSTKYGILYYVVECTLDNIYYTNSDASAFSTITLSKVVGSSKLVATTKPSITSNKFSITVNTTNTTGTYVKLKDIRGFELPAGSQIEADFTNLTADQLAVKYPYVNGGEVRAVESTRVKSVGKNLFNKSTVTDGFFTVATGQITLGAGQTISDFMKVKPNTKYTRTAVGDSQYKYVYYDKNKNFISGQAITGTITTPVACEYMRIGWDTGANINLIQVEENYFATPYEPYKETTAVIPSVGHILPNGIYDEIDVKTGVKIQRIKESIITSADVTAIDVGVYVSRVRIKKPIAGIGAMSATTVFWSLIEGYTEIIGGQLDVLSQIGQYSSGQVTNEFCLFVPVGVCSTLEQARVMFEGTKIYYQLSTPIVTELNVIGDITAFANGSITTEPSISGYTNTSVTLVTTASLPISAIRKVTKYTIATNHMVVETDVTADVTITGAGTSLTIANFDPDSNYFYDCEYPSYLTVNAEIIADCEVDGGVVTHDYGATATAWTLTDNESRAEYFSLTNAGGNSTMVMRPQDGVRKVIKNTSSKTITVKTATSTGVAIENGFTVTVMYNGSDYVEVNKDDTARQEIIELSAYAKTPVATYTHTSNKEVAVSAVDTTTDTFTSVAHGLANNDVIFPILNLGNAVTFPLAVYAGGMVQGAYYVVNKTNDTFQISLTSSGTAIDLIVNATVDLTKWHFERCSVGSIVISNLPAATKYRGIVNFRTGYSPSFYMYSNIATQVFAASGANLVAPLVINAQNCGVGGTFSYEIDHSVGIFYKFEGMVVSVNNANADALVVTSLNSVWRGNAVSPSNITSITLAPQLNVFANGTIVEVYKA